LRIELRNGAPDYGPEIGIVGARQSAVLPARSGFAGRIGWPSGFVGAHDRFLPEALYMGGGTPKGHLDAFKATAPGDPVRSGRTGPELQAIQEDAGGQRGCAAKRK
jgi:hypothetical protein